MRFALALAAAAVLCPVQANATEILSYTLSPHQGLGPRLTSSQLDRLSMVIISASYAVSDMVHLTAGAQGWTGSLYRAYSGTAYNELIFTSTFSSKQITLGAGESVDLPVGPQFNISAVLQRGNSDLTYGTGYYFATHGIFFDPGYYGFYDFDTTRGSETSIFTPGALTGSLTIKYYINDIGAIPEPATWAMMLTGFFAIGAVLRRQAATSVSLLYLQAAKPGL